MLKVISIALACWLIFTGVCELQRVARWATMRVGCRLEQAAHTIDGAPRRPTQCDHVIAGLRARHEAGSW